MKKIHVWANNVRNKLRKKEEWKREQQKKCNLNFFVASIHWQLFLSTRKIFMRMKVCRHMGTLPDTNTHSNRKTEHSLNRQWKRSHQNHRHGFVVNDVRHSMLFTIPSFLIGRSFKRLSYCMCSCSYCVRRNCISTRSSHRSITSCWRNCWL